MPVFLSTTLPLTVPPTLCYVSRFLYLYIRLLLSLSVACRLSHMHWLPACLPVCGCSAVGSCCGLHSPAQSCPFLSSDESSSSQWPKNIMKLLTWSCNVPFDFVAQHSARSGQTAELCVCVCVASGLLRNRESGRVKEGASNSTASTTMWLKIRTAARQIGKWATPVDASLSQSVNPTDSQILRHCLSRSLTLFSSVSLALIVSADDVWKVYLLSKHHEMLTKYTKTADALNARVAAAKRLTLATTWDREKKRDREWVWERNFESEGVRAWEGENICNLTATQLEQLQQLQQHRLHQLHWLLNALMHCHNTNFGYNGNNNSSSCNCIRTTTCSTATTIVENAFGKCKSSLPTAQGAQQAYVGMKRCVARWEAGREG